jgi:hypothetical protein
MFNYKRKKPAVLTNCGLFILKMWRCRDSNPGPDKETDGLSTCLGLFGLLGVCKYKPGLCALLRCFVSPVHRTLTQTSKPDRSL